MVKCPIKLPVKIGTSEGFNCNVITDANDEEVLSLFNVPLHTTVEELRKLPQFAEGLKRAKFIVRAINTYGRYRN